MEGKAIETIVALPWRYRGCTPVVVSAQFRCISDDPLGVSGLVVALKLVSAPFRFVSDDPLGVGARCSAPANGRPELGAQRPEQQRKGSGRGRGRGNGRGGGGGGGEEEEEKKKKQKKKKKKKKRRRRRR